MDVLFIRGARLIATKHGYEEIYHNEESRVLSFRGGPNKSTRINFYYTTGTVGTCLNHPKRGKTQLFRRNINTFEKLEAIFQNPRSHTGEGYYTRRNIRQQWKHSTTDDTYLVDSARRWLWVGSSVGLVKNERERTTITQICTKWDNIVWNPGSIPSIQYFRHRCGTIAGLVTEVLFFVVAGTYGNYQLCIKDDVNNYFYGDGTHEKPKARNNENFYCAAGRDCPQVLAFYDAHFANGDDTSDVIVLRNLFMSLRKDIRIELAQWFLERVDSRDGVFTGVDGSPLRSKYHYALHFAHIEYGELNYPRKSGLVDYLGVMKNQNIWCIERTCGSLC